MPPEVHILNVRLIAYCTNDWLWVKIKKQSRHLKRAKNEGLIQLQVASTKTHTLETSNSPEDEDLQEYDF